MLRVLLLLFCRDFVFCLIFVVVFAVFVCDWFFYSCLFCLFDFTFFLFLFFCSWFFVGFWGLLVGLC